MNFFAGKKMMYSMLQHMWFITMQGMIPFQGMMRMLNHIPLVRS